MNDAGLFKAAPIDVGREHQRPNVWIVQPVVKLAVHLKVYEAAAVGAFTLDIKGQPLP